MISPIRRWSKRFQELAAEQREVLGSVVFLGVWLGIGSFTYAVLEGWSLLDGLYMSFITLTTIGFSEVHSLTVAGRLFTMFFAFVGIGSMAFGAARGAQLLVSADRIHQRRLTRLLRRMRDHFIVCGYGRIGRRVVQDLRAHGKEVVVVERKGSLIAELRNEGIAYFEGDATDEKTLVGSGITHAKALITVLPQDSTNVYVTLVGRDLNPDLFILARTTHVNNRRRLLQAGATKVVAPTRIGAIHMAQVILRPHVDRFLTHVMKVEESGLIIDEVLVEEGSFLAGQSLASAHFRQHFDTIVLSIVNGTTGGMQFNPGPRDMINAGDRLIVLGSGEMVEVLTRDGCSADTGAVSPPSSHDDGAT